MHWFLFITRCALLTDSCVLIYFPRFLFTPPLALSLVPYYPLFIIHSASSIMIQSPFTTPSPQLVKHRTSFATPTPSFIHYTSPLLHYNPTFTTPPFTTPFPTSLLPSEAKTRAEGTKRKENVVSAWKGAGRRPQQQRQKQHQPYGIPADTRAGGRGEVAT